MANANRDRLQIFLSRRQLVGVQNPDASLADQVTGNVIVVCNEDGTATYIAGDVDTTEIDFTEFTQGLDKLTLSWDAVNSSGTNDTAETNQAGSNYDKGITADLTFNDKAFDFIDGWLLESPCGILNAINARIVDKICDNQYRIFEIKADNITRAPIDRPCEFTVKLREADAVWHCVHKTFIWDNWQNWFIDGSTKQHPCFLTAVEPRPRLIASARMGISIFAQTIPVINAIFNENDNVFRRILNVDNFVDAPLIRDIITNVAGKCGLSVDTMFHDPANPYYNLTLFYPFAGQWHENDNSSVTSPALWFHFANRWDVTLGELLDKLKVPFQAEWYVTPNSTLVFKPKTVFYALVPILDFTTGDLPVWSLEYTFDGDKKPAYGRYQYLVDGVDLAAQEVAPLYNDITDYDGPTNNAMLEGDVTKDLEFASVGFVRDGMAQGDYMRDLVNDGETIGYGLVILLGVVIAALAAGALTIGASVALAAFLVAWIAAIASKANDLRDNFGSDVYTGAVRITADQASTARLILWDGESLNRAKAVQVDPTAIEANLFYNPTAIPYTTDNQFQYTPVGGLKVMNYPMYFDSFYVGNLYDRFQDALDNPLKSLDTHQSFEFYTDLCCDVLDALGTWDGDFAKIGYQVKLPDTKNRVAFGRIQHFEVNYELNQVRLRGRVIKKASA